MFSFWGVFFSGLGPSRVGIFLPSRVKKKKKEECFSLYFLCVFAAAAANRRHYFVKVCSTTSVGDIVSAGFRDPRRPRDLF